MTVCSAGRRLGAGSSQILGTSVSSLRLGWAATVIEIPLRTGRGQNDREHWRVRARRVRGEREVVAWALRGWTQPAVPCVIRLTRIAPSNGLDDDNLAGALKGVRDQVAQWLGVDDKRSDVVRYVYTQARGPWAVRIQVE